MDVSSALVVTVFYVGEGCSILKYSEYDAAVRQKIRIFH